MKAVRGSCGGAAKRGFIQRKSKRHSQWSWCVMAGYSTQLAAGGLSNKKRKESTWHRRSQSLARAAPGLGLIAGVLNLRGRSEMVDHRDMVCMCPSA